MQSINMEEKTPTDRGR